MRVGGGGGVAGGGQHSQLLHLLCGVAVNVADDLVTQVAWAGGGGRVLLTDPK